MERFTVAELTAHLAAISPRLWVHKSDDAVTIMYEAKSAPEGINKFRGPIARGRRPALAWALFQERRQLYGF